LQCSSSSEKFEPVDKAGIIAGLNTIPGVSPQTGIYIFAAALILKDVANRVDEVLH